MMKKTLRILFCGLLALFLTACAVRNIPDGGLTGAYGCFAEQQDNRASQLESNHVSVQQLGDQIFFLTSDDQIFAQGESTTISNKGADRLNLIAHFLRCYRKEAVRITVYTNIKSTDEDNIALSKLKAQKIVDYFSNEKINASVLYGIGGGVSVHTDSQMGTRYIEITTTVMP